MDGHYLIYVEKLLNHKDGNNDPVNRKMINSFEYNYYMYSRVLENILANGNISIEEKAKLYQLRAKMFSDNLKILKNNSSITSDNKDVLLKILEIINQLRDNENTSS